MQTKLISILPFIFSGFFLPSAMQCQTGEWELKRDKNGIKVFVREVAGSKIKEMKFTTTLLASIHTVGAVLANVEGYDEWVYANMHSETVKKISETECYYYCQLDFPWPLDNRDLVGHTVNWQDPKTLIFYSKTTSAHWMKSEEEGLVRITKADQLWTFTPLGNGWLRAEYSLSSDPGGSIPAWAINLAADQGPLQSMIKFKEMLAMEKYRNAKLAFLQER